MAEGRVSRAGSRGERVVIRLTGAERGVVEAAAGKMRMGISGWGRLVMVGEAEKQVGEAVGVEVARAVASPDVKPPAAPKLKAGVAELAARHTPTKRGALRPGDRCPHCFKKGCKGDCW